MTKCSNGCVPLMIALLAVPGLSLSVALAQTDQPPRQGQPARGLGGPKVDDKNAPGVNNSFGGNTDRRYAGREIPQQVFMRAVMETVGEGAEGDLRASPEVQDQIRAAAEEFGKLQREYYQKNRAEMEKVRRAGGEGPGGRPGGAGPGPGGEKPAESTDGMKPDGPPMSDAEREQMMERARELREGAPKPGDVQKKIWSLLSEPQRKAVDARLEAFRAEQEKRSNEEYKKRLLNQRSKQDGAEQSKPEQGKPGQVKPEQAKPDQTKPGQARPNRAAGPRERAPLPPEFRERLMRLIEQMTPEEREQLLQRLEQRIRERRGGGPEVSPAQPGPPNARPAREGGDGVVPKPAPKIDGVKVPDPK